MVTLTNQKDQMNQLERNLSKPRFALGEKQKQQEQKDQDKEIRKDSISASDASDEEAKRRQIEAIEDIVDEKKGEYKSRVETPKENIKTVFDFPQLEVKSMVDDQR